MLTSLKKLHNTTDIIIRKRLIRAIEIEIYNNQHPEILQDTSKKIESKIFGIMLERDMVRERITERLRKRLEQGMIEEVKKLLETVPAEKLIYYGLEYKFITRYLLGQLTYEEMFSQLNIAIHQFSKRQMTWFRGMEKRGFTISWIDGLLPMDDKIKLILNSL